ncbi:IS3 family transposase [Mucilaginibacter gynuensis]
MKDIYTRISLVRLCRLLGITRQDYYQHFWQQEALGIEDALVLQEVISIRRDHRVMGGRKLYEMLHPFLLEHGIKMGRDALFDLLAANGLLVKKRRRRHVTTWSGHRFNRWPNIIRKLEVKRPNQLWVSDITYWKVKEEHLYISLITDAFSHKVVGYHLADTLETVETIQALKMALKDLPEQLPGALIHHSDRGVQYCTASYVKLLQDQGIRISMTENGDPLENAVAERMNGILKEEYLRHHRPENKQEAKQLLNKAIELYNQYRPHYSIGLLTPQHVHISSLLPEKLWKNYYVKKTNIVNVAQDITVTVNT